MADKIVPLRGNRVDGIRGQQQHQQKKETREMVRSDKKLNGRVESLFLVRYLLTCCISFDSSLLGKLVSVFVK